MEFPTMKKKSFESGQPAREFLEISQFSNFKILNVFSVSASILSFEHQGLILDFLTTCATLSNLFSTQQNILYSVANFEHSLFFFFQFPNIFYSSQVKTKTSLSPKT
jgi:hypothetical protein